MSVLATPIGDVWPEPTSAASGEWDWISELIAEEGRSIILFKGEDTKDPSEPWREQSVYSSLTVTGVVLNYKSKDIDGDIIRNTDKQAMIAALAGINLEEYDKLSDPDGTGDTYEIVGVSKIMPGTQKLLYTLQVRR